MPAETLAEILEEGKRLDREAATCQCAGNNPRCLRMRDGFARQHFPRLVAVAEAAVEMRKAELAVRRMPLNRETTCEERDVIVRRRDMAEIAFDALASPAPGAGEEGNGVAPR